MEHRDIVELAAARDDLTTLVSALTDTNLTDTLSGTGPFTVLAPTDTAFSSITIPTDNAVLTEVLLYHVIGADILSNALTSGAVYTTQESDDQTVTVFLDGSDAYFYDSMGNLAQVTVTDIVGTNGIIHVIDTVLMPDGTIDDITGTITDLSSLDSALDSEGLASTLADTSAELTLFAPSNDAVSAFTGPITYDLLLGHVVTAKYLSTDVPMTETVLTTSIGANLTVIRDAEGGVTVTDSVGNMASVTTANIAGVNGVVHIIDSVLEHRNIVELANQRTDLTTLVNALTDTNLTDVLSGTGPFTVLAPTDTAFSAITVPTDNAVLTDILKYHVIGDEVFSTDLSTGLVATTLESDSQTVTAVVDSGVYFFDSMGRLSQVTVADIEGTNGVIHVIDTVLLPDGTINDIVGNNVELSILDGALAGYGLNDTLADTSSEFTLFAPLNAAVEAFTGEITSDILTYHVVANKYLAADVPETATVLETVNGENITVVRNVNSDSSSLNIYGLNYNVTVTDAEGNVAVVTTVNIAGVNGVVHIIDSVLDTGAVTPSTTEDEISTTEDESNAVSMGVVIASIVGVFASLF